MVQLTTRNPQCSQKRRFSDGILLVDKNEGETTYSIVRKVRKKVGSKKVGHAGSLDPFATGLIIILLGQGTKLSQYLMIGRKRYLATMCLGAETDTMDLTGRITRTRHVPDLSLEKIRETALEFLGEIEQVPPIFSAVNINGKRAYVLARKGIRINLKRRKVNIYSLEIISVDLPFVSLDIVCSGGTYIRSLAADFGNKLGTGAHLKTLRRLKSGPFDVEASIDSKELGDADPTELVENNVISLKDALPDIKEIIIDSASAKKIRNGLKSELKEIFSTFSSQDIYNDYIKLVEGTNLVAIVEMDHKDKSDEGCLKRIRVFNQA